MVTICIKLYNANSSMKLTLFNYNSISVKLSSMCIIPKVCISLHSIVILSNAVVIPTFQNKSLLGTQVTITNNTINTIVNN